MIQSFKRNIKRTIKHTAKTASGWRTHESGTTRILTYHSVGNRPHPMNVSPQSFREQVTWLADYYPVIWMEDLLGGKPGVAITFDDGYRDNLTNAAPILSELGLPATVFIVPGRVGGRLHHDGDAPGAELMTWEEIKELRATGFSVGSHSMTHARLSKLDPAAQRHEIVDSKDIIEDQLSEPVAGFAYPFGSALDYDAVSRELVQEAGYHYAASNKYGPMRTPCDPWELRRIWIDDTDDLESFQAKIDGRLDALAWLDSPAAIRGRRALNRLLGLG